MTRNLWWARLPSLPWSDDFVRHKVTGREGHGQRSTDRQFSGYGVELLKKVCYDSEDLCVHQDSWWTGMDSLFILSQFGTRGTGHNASQQFDFWSNGESDSKILTYGTQLDFFFGSAIVTVDHGTLTISPSHLLILQPWTTENEMQARHRRHCSILRRPHEIPSWRCRRSSKIYNLNANFWFRGSFVFIETGYPTTCAFNVSRF